MQIEEGGKEINPANIENNDPWTWQGKCLWVGQLSNGTFGRDTVCWLLLVINFLVGHTAQSLQLIDWLSVPNLEMTVFLVLDY